MAILIFYSTQIMMCILLIEIIIMTAFPNFVSPDIMSLILLGTGFIFVTVLIANIVYGMISKGFKVKWTVYDSRSVFLASRGKAARKSIICIGTIDETHWYFIDNDTLDQLEEYETYEFWVEGSGCTLLEGVDETERKNYD